MVIKVKKFDKRSSGCNSQYKVKDKRPREEVKSVTVKSGIQRPGNLEFKYLSQKKTTSQI